MSTRCNIVLIDQRTGEGHPPVIFYQHGDGYPEGVREKLDTFIRWVEERRIRRNTGQSSGWLHFLGIQDMARSAAKYAADPRPLWPHFGPGKGILDVEPRVPDEHNMNHVRQYPNDPWAQGIAGEDWECGFVEYTDCLHGDIEFLHVVDMKNVRWYSMEAPDMDAFGRTKADLHKWLLEEVPEWLAGRSPNRFFMYPREDGPEMCRVELRNGTVAEYVLDDAVCGEDGEVVKLMRGAACINTYHVSEVVSIQPV